MMAQAAAPLSQKGGWGDSPRPCRNYGMAGRDKVGGWGRFSLTQPSPAGRGLLGAGATPSFRWLATPDGRWVSNRQAGTLGRVVLNGDYAGNPGFVQTGGGLAAMGRWTGSRAAGSDGGGLRRRCGRLRRRGWYCAVGYFGGGYCCAAAVGRKYAVGNPGGGGYSGGGYPANIRPGGGNPGGNPAVRRRNPGAGRAAPYGRCRCAAAG